MSTNQFVLNHYCHVQIHLQEAVFVIQKSLICTRHICEKRFFLNYRHHLQRSERSKCTKNIYECGEKGLNNPKKELLTATNKLISQIKI